MLERAEDEVPVLAHGDRLVPATDPLDDPPGEEQGRKCHQEAAEQALDHRLPSNVRRDDLERPQLGVAIRGRAVRDDVAPAPDREQVGRALGRKDVVAVDEPDPVSRRVLEADVPRV